MVRRLFPILAAVFILMLCVVPVAASSGVGPHDKMLYSSVPIKSVSFGDDTIVDWPNNSFSNGAAQATVTAFDGKFVANCYGSDIFLETDFRYMGSNGFTFLLSDFFLSGDDSFKLYAAYESNVIFTSLKISGNLLTVRSSSNRFLMDSQYFDTFVEIDSYSIDVFSYLRNVLGSYAGYNADSLTFLSGVVVDVSFYVESSANPNDFVTVEVSQGVPENYNTWFDSQRLASKIKAPGMFDWLRDSIDSFFDFELYPGFSMNRLFYLVFIIGIVLWIFKAVH